MDSSNPSISTAQTINNAMPWVEKYRPSCFDEIVLDPMNRTILSNILKTNYFPNLLFLEILEFLNLYFKKNLEK
jgi:hypothetical protein